jgi:hypothetical protein
MAGISHGRTVISRTSSDNSGAARRAIAPLPGGRFGPLAGAGGEGRVWWIGRPGGISGGRPPGPSPSGGRLALAQAPTAQEYDIYVSLKYDASVSSDSGVRAQTGYRCRPGNMTPVSVSKVVPGNSPVKGPPGGAPACGAIELPHRQAAQAPAAHAAPAPPGRASALPAVGAQPFPDCSPAASLGMAARSGTRGPRSRPLSPPRRKWLAKAGPAGV